MPRNFMFILRTNNHQVTIDLRRMKLLRHLKRLFR